MKRALAALAAIPCAYLGWHLSTSSPAQDSATPVAGPATGAGSPTPSTRPAAPPWVGIGEDAPTVAEYWAKLSDPSRSDLSAPLATEASAIGAALLEADVTAVGRDAFYGYWGVGRAQPCCRDLVIHAAGASSTSTPGVVQVAVIWSAERLDGERVANETTVVFLAHRGTTWVPLHSWELPA